MQLWEWDFLGFRPSQIDIKDIISIIDWVEGTRAIIDIYVEKDIPTTELLKISRHTCDGRNRYYSTQMV